MPPVTKALMETDAGTIELELFDADAPNTVANFVKLANEGFYDGLAFHRVIPGFMAQGGCPNSREGSRGMAGTGGPGYQIDCEINPQKHQAGTLAMAHAGRNTGGSQFYLCFEPQPHLDGQHTVFGHTDDMDVVLKLRNGSETDVDCGGGTCGKCGTGKMCSVTADCAAGACTGGFCQAASEWPRMVSNSLRPIHPTV